MAIQTEQPEDANLKTQFTIEDIPKILSGIPDLAAIIRQAFVEGEIDSYEQLGFYIFGLLYGTNQKTNSYHNRGNSTDDVIYIGQRQEDNTFSSVLPPHSRVIFTSERKLFNGEGIYVVRMYVFTDADPINAGIWNSDPRLRFTTEKPIYGIQSRTRRHTMFHPMPA